MEKTVIVLILAHGLFGWGDNVKRQDQMTVYYAGVKPFLEQEYGTRPDLKLVICAPTVPAAESVAVRGAVLKKAIEGALQDQPPGTRAHIIGHSMGGLDSRWVILQDGMADKIASLTTIATPHRGTTLGDLAYDELPIVMPAGKFVEFLAKWRGWIWRHLPFTRAASGDQLKFLEQLLAGFDSSQEQMSRALYALTLEGAGEFNSQYADAERAVLARTTKRVVYIAYGGVMQPHQIPLLEIPYEVITIFGTPAEKKDGNDGAVSVWSAHFPWDDSGNYYMSTIPFDHLMQINWRIPDTRPDDKLDDKLKPVYREIMERIIQVARTQ